MALSTGPENKVEEILSKFAGPVYLRSDPAKWSLVLIGCGAFLLIAIVMVRNGDPYGWAVVFFCSVGGLIALATILPGGSGLKLAKEDFEVTRFFRRHLYNWQNTGEFLPYRISSRQSGVVFNDGSARAGIATRMNIALSGRNSYLPDTYGLSASDLVSLMTRWGERAMRRASTSIPN